MALMLRQCNSRQRNEPCSIIFIQFFFRYISCFSRKPYNLLLFDMIYCTRRQEIEPLWVLNMIWSIKQNSYHHSGTASACANNRWNYFQFIQLQTVVIDFLKTIYQFSFQKLSFKVFALFCFCWRQITLLTTKSLSPYIVRWTDWMMWRSYHSLQ